MASALARSIGLIHKDQSIVIEALTADFTTDYSQFATANNRAALEEAVKLLGKSKADKAILEAINAGIKAGALPTGYIGARTGAFSKQGGDIQKPFIDAINRASEAFSASLNTSDLFAPKAQKTEEEKAQAKREREDKQAQASEALIQAKIDAGELVRASDAITIDKLSALALAEALERIGQAAIGSEAGNIVASLAGMPEVLAALATITAERDALQTALAEATAERDALQTALAEATAERDAQSAMRSARAPKRKVST